MNKQLKITVCIVMVAAVTLMVICLSHYLNLGKQLHAYEQQLSESRKHWEAIAEEKETLQADLKEKQDNLKEARLSMEEATEKAEELRTEIVQLKQEIEKLKRDNPDK